GRQVDGIGRGSLLLEGRDDILAVLERPVCRHPALIDIDAKILARQVAHVALARGHFKVGPEVLVNRLGLGRRLHDDQVFLLPCSHERLLSSGTHVSPRTPAGSRVGVVFVREPTTIPILSESATHPYYTNLSSVKSGSLTATDTSPQSKDVKWR